MHLSTSSSMGWEDGFVQDQSAKRFDVNLDTLHTVGLDGDAQAQKKKPRCSPKRYELMSAY